MDLEVRGDVNNVCTKIQHGAQSLLLINAAAVNLATWHARRRALAMGKLRR